MNGKWSYDPEKFKNWAEGVIDYINGAGNSVQSLSKRFGKQIELLVQPGTWTGQDALDNYNNFVDTHTAFTKFINSFGQTFEACMNDVNTRVRDLQITNLGTSTNVANYGNLSFSQIDALSKTNIVTERVTYDVNTITTIATELNSIKNSLDGLVDDMKNKISTLTNGAMTGDGAENIKNTLNKAVTTNYAEISPLLDTCISNINTAAENAAAVNAGLANQG